jgi:hypothetical protein
MRRSHPSYKNSWFTPCSTSSIGRFSMDRFRCSATSRRAPLRERSDDDLRFQLAVAGVKAGTAAELSRQMAICTASWSRARAHGPPLWLRS